MHTDLYRLFLPSLVERSLPLELGHRSRQREHTGADVGTISVAKELVPELSPSPLASSASPPIMLDSAPSAGTTSWISVSRRRL